jgi:Proteasome non-ATPase 26S subunit
MHAITILKEHLNSTTETRIRVLQCLESLLKMKESDIGVSNICYKWYCAFSENSMDTICQYAKNPFIDIRLAGFGVLNAVSQHHWGQEAVKNTPGNLRYSYKPKHGKIFN